MAERVPKYITTTLPYVNDEPHIGHALEFIQADALARYWRHEKHDVFFNIGTDEHGQKVAQKADEAGEDRQAYVDRFAHRFAQLQETLHLSADAFVRTSSQQHKAAARELWRRCNANGDIYKQKYTGLYCVGCEMFLREGDLIHGRCPNHPGRVPEEIEEENYFFALSKYAASLTEYLKDPKRTLPEWQRQWALGFVEAGLDDLSISREKSRMNWGVPVPGDNEHVMYVWFDALTNYISTLGWPDDKEGLYHKFWEGGETLQLAGKDQVRFQSIIFQAMLMSAGLPTTTTIVYHGFINSGGQKMSKSIGNVISPYAMVERYGPDAARYMLLRHIHPTDDSDLTWEKMDGHYTDHLVHGLGNLVARVMKMAETHLEEPVEVTPGNRPAAYEEAFRTYDFQGVGDCIWKHIGSLDEYITETEPFKIVKTDKPAAQEIIAELVVRLAAIGELLVPIMPETADLIRQAIKVNRKPENLFTHLEL